MMDRRQYTDDWIETLLKSLRDAKFFGKITIEMKEGMIVLIRREETIKPPVGDR